MLMPVHLQLAHQIVDTLKSICDHDINYIDIHGQIYASTDESRVGDYHEGGHQAARSGEIIVIEKDDPLTGIRKGINMPIRYNGETVAVIGITGEPEEVRRYAFLAQRITLLLLREHEIDLKDHNHQAQINYVVRSLITNERIHPDFLNEVLKKNRIPSPEGDWQTVVFLLNQRYNLSNLSMIETRLYQTFDMMGHCLYTYCYPNEYVLIIESAVLKQNMPMFSALAEQFQGILQAGIGAQKRFIRQYQSYQSAKLAIQNLSPGQSIIRFEDLDLEILLASVPEHARDSFLNKCTKGLDEDDHLLLETYFSCEMGLKETSEKLFLHKNTLQYRLNRIRERCGYDPRSFQDAVVLYAALKLEKQRRLKQS